MAETEYDIREIRSIRKDLNFNIGSTLLDAPIYTAVNGITQVYEAQIKAHLATGRALDAVVSRTSGEPSLRAVSAAADYIDRISGPLFFKKGLDLIEISEGSPETAFVGAVFLDVGFGHNSIVGPLKIITCSEDDLREGLGQAGENLNTHEFSLSEIVERAMRTREQFMSAFLAESSRTGFPVVDERFLEIKDGDMNGFPENSFQLALVAGADMARKTYKKIHPLIVDLIQKSA